MQQFLLPDPGEGLVEAEIVSWHVKAGDQVKINDILLEVETSKSIVELPSPYAGTVGSLLVAEGDTVEVGTPIITIDDGSGTGGQDSGGADEASAGAGSAEGSERVANLVGYGPRETQTRRRARKSTQATPGPQAAPEPQAAPGPEEGPGAQEALAPHDAVADAFATDHPVSRRADTTAPLHPVPAEPVGEPLPTPGEAAAEPHPNPDQPATTVLAKPPVRKLAKDLGLDLRTITGTGPGGVITRDDVEAAGMAPAEDAAELPTSATSVEDVRIPIKGVRKATAQAMVDSAFTAPHVTEWVTCDVTALMALVEKLKARREFAEVKISPLLIIAKAALLALRRTPAMNSSWDEAAQEIVQYGEVNLGIAAATPRGLVVPNIKAADRLSLLGLAEALTQLVGVAREGRTQPAEMSGGTFTITNVGVFGVDAGTPILNPGESGILAVGAINRRPWVVGTGADERIEPRWVTTLAVSFDHRVVDGEQGSHFLADLAEILTDPATALLY